MARWDENAAQRKDAPLQQQCNDEHQRNARTSEDKVQRDRTIARWRSHGRRPIVHYRALYLHAAAVRVVWWGVAGGVKTRGWAGPRRNHSFCVTVARARFAWGTACEHTRHATVICVFPVVPRRRFVVRMLQTFLLARRQIFGKEGALERWRGKLQLPFQHRGCGRTSGFFP